MKRSKTGIKLWVKNKSYKENYVNYLILHAENKVKKKHKKDTTLDRINTHISPAKVKQLCIKCIKNQVYPGHNASASEKICEECK